MSNNKQSSVEYYINNLIDILGDEICNKLTIEQTNRIHFLGKQAKAMHKEEIIDSHESGMADGYYFEGSQSDYESEGATKYFGEQHYEQTFGGNK